jgi:acetyl-CoA carboxylase carboxyltransferase component
VTHATRTGVASFLLDDESSCFDEVRYLLSLLPSNNHEDPPYVVPGDRPSRRCDELLDIVPAEPNRAYGVRDVIEVIEVIGTISRCSRCGRPTSCAPWRGWMVTSWG